MQYRQTSYEATAAKLVRYQPKPRVYARFVNGRLLVGTQSLHNTTQGRQWRLFWRLKTRRMAQQLKQRNL